MVGKLPVRKVDCCEGADVGRREGEERSDGAGCWGESGEQKMEILEKQNY